MRDRSRRNLTIVALVAMVLGSAPARARADDTLTVIGGSGPAAFYDVIDHVAERAGFYKEEHLIVNPLYANNPYTAAQIVATGKADICSLSMDPIFQGYDKGIRLQAFFLRDPQNQFVLAVLDSSPIKTLADFKGATLGEVSAGSPGETYANAMLAGAGLKKGDVSYIPIGFGAQELTAFVAKKVDGAIVPAPGVAFFEAEEHVKFRRFYHPILKDVGNTVYCATPATIAAKADQLSRFARATVKAAIFIRENPQVAARYFLQGAGIKITDDALQKQTRWLQLTQDHLPANDPTSTKIGYISPIGMGIYSAFLASSGATAQAVPVPAILTDQFIAYANDFDHKAFIARAKTMR